MTSGAGMELGDAKAEATGQSAAKLHIPAAIYTV
jgi:hypothetical protein